ncbi:MAG TPA: hypothetical protein VE075_12160 [Thermoanaerobaculia bacterium]|nr:hypothetical protein [Thermoanaerobaculia bacterium]
MRTKSWATGRLVAGLLVATLAASGSLAAGLAAAGGGTQSAALPVRIQFAPGASSASVPVELPRGPSAGALTYVLTGRNGQVLEVGLRIPAKDPAVSLSVSCPGGGHTAIGRHGQLDGSVAMPQTGDYTIAIDKVGTGPLLAGVLTAAVKGAPRMIAARPYTGTYFRDHGSGASVDVQEIGGGKVQFSFLAGQAAVDSAHGPSLGGARGVVELRDGVGVFEKAGCRLELRFGAAGSGTLHVDDGGDCGFGPNATPRGDYRRTSLCAAPEAPGPAPTTRSVKRPNRDTSRDSTRKD